MADIMKARLQTPVDDEGHREDIHLVTDVDAVVYDDDNTLKEFLDKIQRKINDVSNQLENAGSIYLATSGSEPTDSSMMLFAEIINAGDMDNIDDITHNGVNRADMDTVDYYYERATPEAIQGLTRDEMVGRGWKQIVSIPALIEQEITFDPLTMINIRDMVAYNKNQQGVWTQGTYVRKRPKSELEQE